jgi:hypothetical protein
VGDEVTNEKGNDIKPAGGSTEEMMITMVCYVKVSRDCDGDILSRLGGGGRVRSGDKREAEGQDQWVCEKTRERNATRHGMCWQLSRTTDQSSPKMRQHIHVR